MNNEAMTHAEWIEQLYKMDRDKLIANYVDLLDPDERHDLLTGYIDSDSELTEEDIIRRMQDW